MHTTHVRVKYEHLHTLPHTRNQITTRTHTLFMLNCAPTVIQMYANTRNRTHNTSTPHPNPPHTPRIHTPKAPETSFARTHAWTLQHLLTHPCTHTRARTPTHS
eukprot:GDKI01045086.1.p1 GENE.GDKI01045086.1~~GDKI01045086.1.p1  ORF type:complete len:104 (-),score=26.87 GDKI01045086.1:243-554(-)